MLIKNPIIANKKPTGNINITTTSPVDVTNYATATVVDSNLVAGNIKSRVSILGVSGNVTPAKTEQTKTVTFSSDGQEVTPDSGLVLSKVTINKPANLISENIKSGVTIAGVSGSYSGGTDYLALRCNQTTNYSYSSNEVTEVGNYAFYNDKKITSVSLPNATNISMYAFNTCTLLATAIFSSATSIGSNAFGGCPALATISFPAVTSLSTSAFNTCTSLTSVSFPSLTSISSNAFLSCTNLTSITLAKNQVCTLNNVNAIPATSNHHVNIYVPISLVASYRTATNWSTLYNNGYISILPIDGQLITTSVTNGTYSGDIAIANNGTATVTLSANNGYDLPSSITVSGASYTYNSTTGVVSLSNPTGAVSITAVCVQVVSGYTLSVSSFGTSPYGTGHAYYSLDDGSTWVEITGTGTLTTTASQVKFKTVEDSPAMESIYIKSTTLNLNLQNYGGATSSNYILSSNVTDITIEFIDQD